MATHDRDRLVEELLRRTPRVRAGDDSCLDAEMLAAWIDGGLSSQDRARAESHLSDCSRCQAMIAAVGRTEPSPTTTEPWWRRDWGFGWLVPLTAGAAAIALWIAVPSRNPSFVEAPENAVAQRQSEARAEPAPPAPGLAPPAAIDALTPAEARDSAQPAPMQRRLKEEEQNGRRNQPSPERDRQVERENLERADQATAENRSALARSEPTASNDAAAKMASAAAPTAQPPAASPAPPQAASQRFAPVVAGALKAETAAPSLLIVSPDPRFRWRIVQSTSLQYSDSTGASWETLTLPATTQITAGAAPSSTVCWLVGRSGTVWRTSDGRRWERLPFPETGDLTAIEASDARSASVTAADGKRFRTTDGGLNWTLLQEF